MQKRGQAAIEFLTTYGWAFIVIIIAIAALGYFGILSPSKSLPDRCDFGPEIECRDFATFGDGISLRMKNNAGEPIVIDKITASNEKLNCPSPTLSFLLKADEINDLYFICDVTGYGFPKNEKVRLNLEVDYHSASSSSSFNRKVSGEIYSTVSGSVYDQVNISAEAQSAINTAASLIVAVNAFNRDIGFFPLDVGRGNDPGLAQMFPNNPETGELLSPAGSRCNPVDWNATAQQRWMGPYLSAWPNQTPWGGEYDYNIWPDGAVRYGLNVPPGIYLGIQGDRSDAPGTHIPLDAENDLVSRGLDADGGINGETQLFLSSISC